jgi:uncharacterized protein
LKTLLKALVGSQAHGLASPESDYDWRGVFAHPTSEILSLAPNTRTTVWIEGKEDDTSWEVGHFLFLATKCNPSVLEIFVSTHWTADEWGEELRHLFSYLWNSRGVRDAFVGYGLNQRKKFLDDKDRRAGKYAVAYLRSLFCAQQLLSTGIFSLSVVGTPIEEACRNWREGWFSKGEVIQTCADWEEEVRKAYDANPNKEADLAPVNDYLLRFRKANWDA